METFSEEKYLTGLTRTWLDDDIDLRFMIKYWLKIGWTKYQIAENVRDYVIDHWDYTGLLNDYINYCVGKVDWLKVADLLIEAWV